MRWSPSEGVPAQPRCAKLKKNVLHPQSIQPQCFLEGEDQQLEQTEKDVFERLCISGVGEAVMALIDKAWNESESSNAKVELASENEEVPEAQPL